MTTDPASGPLRLAIGGFGAAAQRESSAATQQEFSTAAQQEFSTAAEEGFGAAGQPGLGAVAQKAAGCSAAGQRGRRADRVLGDLAQDNDALRTEPIGQPGLDRGGAGHGVWLGGGRRGGE